MPFFTNVEGYKLYFEDINPGSGKCTIVLLHGFASSASFFKEQIKILKDFYRIIAFDAIGHGRSTLPKKIDITKNLRNDILRDLESLLDYLNLNDPIGIIGHSLVGGMIAMDFSMRYPDRVKFLILLNSGFIMIDNVIRNIFYNLLPYDVRMNFLEILADSVDGIIDKTKPFIKMALLETLEGEPLSDDDLLMKIEDQIFSMINEIKQYNPSSITTPTLIIGGRLDNFAPEQMSEKLHEMLPKSRLEIIGMAGHFGPAQRREVYNELICNFIRDLNCD